MPSALLPWNEADRLAALHSYSVLDTACESAFDNLARLAARLTGCPTALVSLVDEGRQWFKARHGLDMAETSRDSAFCAHTILDPSGALVIEDATKDTRFADNPLVTGLPGIRFYAGVPLVNAEGHALGTLCIIDYAARQLGPDDLETLSDLRQAVMTTLELRRVTNRAREMARLAEQRLVDLVEALPIALILCGTSGLVRLTNRHAEHIFGYDRAELLGQAVEFLLPERFRDRHTGLREGFISDISSRMMGAGQKLFGRRKDGTEFPVEVGLSPFDLDGEQMALAAIIDNTERHEIEREKEEQRRELERSNRDLEEFAYAASHDLKTPLRGISHLVQWIDEDIAPTASPETLENLRLIRDRTTRLQRLLEGLLAYSRVGHTPTPVEDVDIAEVVRGIVAMFEPPPGFVIACEGTMPVIRTSQMPIRVVLANLISNAWVHHDRSGGRITIRARQHGDMHEFRVEDDGPGIEPRFHDRVFVIFQTLANRDTLDSNGIGLAIAKKKVEAHGGRIWIESTPPVRGATFVFTWRESAK